MPSERKFFRTRFTVEVLSEDEISGGAELTDVLRECDIGDFVLHSIDRETFPETGPTMAKLLDDAGSDSEFFRLTPEGDDMDEEA